jgi:Sugar-transfer associated ATP-grasp
VKGKMMSAKSADGILVTQVSNPSVDLASALPRLAKRTGRSVMGLGLDIFLAMRDRRKLTWQEYVLQGAWLDRERPGSFVGAVRNKALNRSLAASSHHDQTNFFRDKILTGQVLEASGFPVPTIRAGFSTERSFGAVPWLATAQALADWLSDPQNLPVFAKPVDGSMSLGSLPLHAAGPGQVNAAGRVVDIPALAEEVARQFGTGWILQELLRQPSEIEALIGPGIGTLRIVTLWEAAGPQLLYGVWRHPAVGTYVDAAIFGKPNLGCALHPETGEVLQARLGDLFSGKQVTASLVSPDRMLVGYRIPGWERVVSMCRDAHRLFPGHALLGWDIAICDRGPVISEVNANPLHMSYQRSFGRGFLHRDHVERLDAARKFLQDRTRK